MFWIYKLLSPIDDENMVNKLRDKYYKKTIFIGDCVKAAKSGDAIRGGYCAALSIN